MIFTDAVGVTDPSITIGFSKTLYSVEEGGEICITIINYAPLEETFTVTFSTVTESAQGIAAL